MTVIREEIKPKKIYRWARKERQSEEKQTAGRKDLFGSHRKTKLVAVRLLNFQIYFLHYSSEYSGRGQGKGIAYSKDFAKYTELNISIKKQA